MVLSNIPYFYALNKSMSGLYIHIPFCRQKCHYCDFHFAVSHRQIPEMVEAIKRELVLRKEEVAQPLETIYLGGGTPSLLTEEQLSGIFETIYAHYKVTGNPEITLEANPDDLSAVYVKTLTKLPVNRLSIGVQSFKQEDLTWMNRVHTSGEAVKCIKTAQDKGFENLTIDLIYGLPEATVKDWQANLELFLSLHIPHVSAYALTVEHQTALQYFIKKGKVKSPEDDKAMADYKLLIEFMKINGFNHYEISNFALPDYLAVHNTAYWQGKPYIGIGPSAHSYNGDQRRWNVAHNSKYIKALNTGVVPYEQENLSVNDRFNEYLMTGLRTVWGVDLMIISHKFGEKYHRYLLEQLASRKDSEHFVVDNKHLKLTETGLFFADGIIADLFYID